MTDAASWTLLAYGLLLVLGGVLGYVIPKTPSKASLIAGTTTGFASIVAFFLSRSQPREGFLLGAFVAAATGTMMLRRFLRTRKPMPGGMLVVLSVVVLAVVLAALLGGDDL